MILKLSSVGEFGLIDILNKDMIFSPESVIAGIGDDTAVLKSPAANWQLFTTDMMLEGIHFRLDWSSYYQVGYKALAVNISDIAAMGGRPTHAVVSVGIPDTVQIENIEELYQGIRDIARRFKINLVGGDTVKSPEKLIINIALLGEVAAGKAIYRSGARPGDIIYTTGNLGKSAAGLYILAHTKELELTSEVKERLILAHTLPEPRVDTGWLLSGLEGVSALDDNSDGLAAELREICRASSVGCLIWEKELPVLAEVKKLAGEQGDVVLDWVMDGGEDYELIFTVRPDHRGTVEQSLNHAGISFSSIGVITAQVNELKIKRINGSEEKINSSGYNHFK